MSLARQIMDAAPTAYWPLDDAAGTTAVDRAGTRHGTYVGGYTLQGGAAVPGLRTVLLGGVNGGVNLPAFGPVGNVSWTFTVWAKCASVTAAPYLLSSRDTTTVLGEVMLVLGNTGTFAATGYGTDSNFDFNTGPAATYAADLQAHQFTVTRGGGSALFYVDGALALTTATAGKSYAQIPGAIGYDRRTPSNFLDGAIGHAAYWASTALTADQIKAQYQAGVRSGVVVG